MCDHVDKIISQWQQERPELDVSPMSLTGRISRLAAFHGREMEKTFRDFNLNSASFDLLATLLRSGAPYALSPSELLAATMVTSGTMTNRIDQLEKVGLVCRKQSEQDKRCFLVELTDAGYRLISEAIEAHVATLHRLASYMTENEQADLNTILKSILLRLEMQAN